MAFQVSKPAITRENEELFCKSTNLTAEVLTVCFYSRNYIFTPTGVIIEFDPVSYGVSEGSPGELVVVVRGESAVPISVDISTRDGTATGEGVEWAGVCGCVCRVQRIIIVFTE